MTRIKLQNILVWGCMGYLVLALSGSYTLTHGAGGVPGLKRPGESTVVPDSFLRRWDPVTIFYDTDTGPATGGPEDRPDRYVTLSPTHPGAYTWLNARTLQFRPAEPWPPLTRFTWKIKDRTISLATLMSAPVGSIPSHNALGLDPVETLTLTFPEPLDPEALARMITIELRPLPGVEEGKAQWLDFNNFDIKILERKTRADRASYVLLFHDPIPVGIRAIVHLRLSLEDRVEESFKRIIFSTARPFKITHFGCADQQYPVTPEGVGYAREQAISCPEDNRKVEVRFSSPPAELTPVEARNLVRFTPAVEDLHFKIEGATLSIFGRFDTDTLYHVTLSPTSIMDKKGRSLKMDGPSHLFIYFEPAESFLSWKTSQGVVERYGPQMVPLEGRGFERLDVRIYPIDPLNRSFWPFPDKPIVVNEESQPFAPGEEPAPFKDARRSISALDLARQLKALGSPTVSTIVPLPLKKRGTAAAFGLDLKPLFERIGGKAGTGTYLVGIRKLDGSTDRSWIRVQATDLSLTTVEEPLHVKFAVTSLATGLPVGGATIRVEGHHREAGRDVWVEIVAGITDQRGIFAWKAPGLRDRGRRYYVHRIVVTKDSDTLVLDPTRAPDLFINNHWESSRGTWLQWTQERLGSRGEPVRTLCHIFTERPVYRPEETVYIKGYIRKLDEGELSPLTGEGLLVVDGPGDLEWRYPVDITPLGSFYREFSEQKLPTGEYRAYLEYDKKKYGMVRFRMEAYRVPKFEVRLHGPDRVSLDKEFSIRLTAKYYAGGRVADRPVRWRVTQFPHTWAPKKIEGYFYSTDARFSGQQRFRSTPVRETEDRTDENGSAVITINPALEPTAQPRRYVIEATVVGADDQTVSNTHQVAALPPFVLGLKVPRYIEKARSIDPELIVVGIEGKLLAGQEVKVRLLQRQWHSHLKAGDFSQGVAKYVTEVVDKKVYETTIISGEEPQRLKLTINRSGVYIVEIESQDRLGRSQVVSVDLFAGGDEPVTWSRPPTQVFKVTSEKPEYAPGETAVLVIESPFQRARALAIVETPAGQNLYEWVNIRNGTATFRLPIKKNYMPSIPVHFVLMRGRIDDGKPIAPHRLDLGKPATLAATAWVKVATVQHRLNVELTYPPKAQPGDEIDVTIKLTDNGGKPLGGEVTLWLVDQAVLALGKEQRLDPLPAFIVTRGSHLTMRDTRNLVLGHLPFQEQPGGGAPAAKKEPEALMDKVTVRKIFKPVPYYNPAIIVGDDGTATVRIKLPGNLTNFKLRAKAVGIPDRFGFAVGHLAVRLPVIVQPSLPRFVRPGDQFTAIAIGRIVEGEGGAGRVSISVDGLDLEEPAYKEIVWEPTVARRIEYSLGVPTPEYTEEGRLSRDAVKVTVAVERTADGARDAFEVSLPIQPDRKPVVQRQLSDLKPGIPLVIPPISDPLRPGSLKRSLLISRDPGLVRMAAGLDYLINYPHGCTEQRISLARAHLASKRFRDLLYQEGAEERIEEVVKKTHSWLETVVDTNGLISYWPGSTGYVSLTAWVVQFMIETHEAGFQVNQVLLDSFTKALRQSLRSDYKNLIFGEAYAERCWALTALAAAGEVDRGYAAELARRAEYLSLESLAQVMLALVRSGESSGPAIEALKRKLWDGIVVRLYQAREVYGGLQEKPSSRNALILPSETRTLAEILRALSAISTEDDQRRLLLRDALVTLGRDDGWGSTNANSAALLALTEFLASTREKGEPRTIEVRTGEHREEITLGSGRSLEHLSNTYAGEIHLALKETGGGGDLVVRSETSYLSAEDGSHVAAHAQGFVVTRELYKIQQGDVPAERLKLDLPGKAIEFLVGDVIEQHIEVVNPKDRHYVAVVIPLAAGMEPLNPFLATAPPEAKPTGQLSLAPSYVAYMDDQMAYYYDSLPKGTYHFYFRTRATIPGRFIQPAAFAEMMYDQAVNGNANGAKILILPKATE